MMKEFNLCYNFIEKKAQSLIMVNSPSMTPNLAISLWPQFSSTICADGGANRLFDGLLASQIEHYHPDVIIGDLDSLRPEVSHAFECAGSLVIRDLDQECNDLDKCLKYILAHLQGAENSTVVILGAYGSRFDQEIAAFNALYQWAGFFQRVVVLSEINASELLLPNRSYVIPVDGIVLKESANCGLLPLGCKVNSITTTGLVWNLHDEPLEFGKRISTSNAVAKGVNEVRVVCSDPILWTCSIESS